MADVYYESRRPTAASTMNNPHHHVIRDPQQSGEDAEEEESRGFYSTPYSTPRVPRQTSFARSFFQAGDQSEGLPSPWSDDREEGGLASNHSSQPPTPNGSTRSLPSPPPGRPRSMMMRMPSKRSVQGSIRFNMLREQSSRRMQGASFFPNLAATDRSVQKDVDQITGSMKDRVRVEESRGVYDREESRGTPHRQELERGGGWARCQQDEILDAKMNNPEVLEQERRMAHHEARQRLRDNLGGDLKDYLAKKWEQASRVYPNVNPTPHYDPDSLPPAPLPDLRMRNIDFSTLPRPGRSEPSIPLPEIPREWFMRRFKNQPRPRELQVGRLVRSASGVPVSASVDRDGGDMVTVVRCLGCEGLLSVGSDAFLARCPECGTVSPATSTHR